MQWGKVEVENGWVYNARISFPIPFPHFVLSASCTTIRQAPGDNGHNYVFDISNTGMNCLFDAGGGYWFALGY